MIAQSTVTLSCSRCGGTTESVAGQQYCQCRYCSSLLQVSEVSVDRIVPTGMMLEHACPVCRQTLQTGLIENQRVLYCMSCLGVLVRQPDFALIVSERRAKRAGLEPAEPRSIDPAAYDRTIECPSCRKAMETHPYYGPGNIVVDTCTPCRFVWLDHGELRRVEEASFMRLADRSAWNSEALSDEARMAEVAVPSPPPADGSKDWPLRALADLLF